MWGWEGHSGHYGIYRRLIELYMVSVKRYLEVTLEISECQLKRRDSERQRELSLKMIECTIGIIRFVIQEDLYHSYI